MIIMFILTTNINIHKLHNMTTLTHPDYNNHHNQITNNHKPAHYNHMTKLNNHNLMEGHDYYV
jgi:hypothetical protein